MRRVPELCLRACAVSAALLAAALLAAAGCSFFDASSDCSPACNILKGCGALPVSDCGFYCASAVSGAPIAGCLDRLNRQDACAKANTTCTKAMPVCTNEVSAYSKCMENYCAGNPNGRGVRGAVGGTGEVRILAFPGGFSLEITWGPARCLPLSSGTWDPPLQDSWPAAGGRDLQWIPGPREDGRPAEYSGTSGQEVPSSTTIPGKYEDRWVRVRFEQGSRSVWTTGLQGDGAAGAPWRGKIRDHVSRGSSPSCQPEASLPFATHPPRVESRRILKTPTARTGTLRGSVIPPAGCSGSCPIRRHSSIRTTTLNGLPAPSRRGRACAFLQTACGRARGLR